MVYFIEPADVATIIGMVTVKFGLGLGVAPRSRDHHPRCGSASGRERQDPMIAGRQFGGGQTKTVL
jgi:hypothetical protein